MTVQVKNFKNNNLFVGVFWSISPGLFCLLFDLLTLNLKSINSKSQKKTYRVL